MPTGLIITAFALTALLLLMALRSSGIPLWVTLRQMSATFFGFLSEQRVATEAAYGSRSNSACVL